MKKALCFMGILILLFLVFLPPALRLFLPDKEVEIVEEEPKNQLLVCKNDRFGISTSYDNNKVYRINFKRFKLLTDNDTETEDNDTEVEDDDESTIDNNTTLDKAFDNIKTDSTITYTDQEDSEIISIDFDIYDHKELDLSLLNKPLEEEKNYYESQGLTCTVKEY